MLNASNVGSPRSIWPLTKKVGVPLTPNFSLARRAESSIACESFWSVRQASNDCSVKPACLAMASYAFGGSGTKAQFFCCSNKTSTIG